ncbi:hypothetical protein C8Q70DRAFT_930728 [Cubamyces menziesii]|nr:hypothetical protein C8Q70DRAFT_930728 [Cubamyces menziesii]
MKDVSSACPQLQLAVGTLLVVLETYKKYSEMTEAIGALLLRINSLNERLAKFQSNDSCPTALKERLGFLASQLQEIVGDARKVQSRWWMVRYLSATYYTKRIESWVKKLDQHINDLSFVGIVEIENTVHKGFDEVNIRLAMVVPMITNESNNSTIALTIADRWKRENLLGASFFCARDGDRSNIKCIFRTIAYQLALHLPIFREHLTKVLETDPDLYSSNPTRQLEKLIVEPLEAARADATSNAAPLPAHIAVVIDALDECTDNAAVSTILVSLAKYIGRFSPLKFLITSRPEVNISRGFLRRELDENTQEFAPNEVPEDLIRRDISAFLQSRLAEIRLNFEFVLNASWPAEEQLKNLVDLSGLLFIFAAAAARYIEDEAEGDPDGRHCGKSKQSESLPQTVLTSLWYTLKMTG